MAYNGLRTIMKKMFFLMSMMLAFAANAAMAQFVFDFKWEENDETFNGAPMVTVGVGESRQLKYSFSSNTLGEAIFDSQDGNWVYYDDNGYVTDKPQCFTIDKNGVVTGVRTGMGALKPTGFIIKASGTERCYVKVVDEYSEKESNNTLETANELKGIPTRFNLSNISDIDYFKVNAKAGDKLVFKIKGCNSSYQYLGYKWMTFIPNTTQISGGSLQLKDGEREIEVNNTEFWGAGEYYIEIYFDPQSTFKFQSGDLLIQAFINDLPVTAVEAVRVGDGGHAKAIFSIDGKRKSQLGKGLNIVKTADGKTVKVVK